MTGCLVNTTSSRMQQQPRAYPFDRLCANNNKRRLTVEVKQSAATSTQIQVDGRMPRYKHIKETYQVPVYLFLSTNRRKIYGGELDFLSAPRKIEYKGRILEYPNDPGGIVYFPLRP